MLVEFQELPPSDAVALPAGGGLLDIDEAWTEREQSPIPPPCNQPIAGRNDFASLRRLTIAMIRGCLDPECRWEGAGFVGVADQQPDVADVDHGIGDPAFGVLESWRYGAQAGDRIDQLQGRQVGDAGGLPWRDGIRGQMEPVFARRSGFVDQYAA